MIKFLNITKFVRAFVLAALVMAALSVSAFAASVTQTTYGVVVDMSGSGAGFTTGDLLSNTSSFLTQYAPFIVLIAAIIFARPILNFIFFVISRIRLNNERTRIAKAYIEKYESGETVKGFKKRNWQ